MLQMSCPADSQPPRAQRVLLCSKTNRQLSRQCGRHGLHNVHSSKVQALFQQQDGELVKPQTLHPN